MKQYLLSFFLVLYSFSLFAGMILIPMDPNQKNHLKAYGVTYWVLSQDVEAYWLLNYRGGSFAFVHTRAFERECILRDVSYEVISNAQFNRIREEISNPAVNQEVIKLEVAPRVAVYTPDYNPYEDGIQPWGDAVTQVLDYAEIPYDKVYDREVLDGRLADYDWLHLHHEDFTGQYGKFYRAYHAHTWYRNHVASLENLAAELGFGKVTHLKSAVVERIREYVAGGGFMFAMCSATDTYDIALAAKGIDIAAEIYDGDPADPNANEKLDFTRTFAFRDFQLEMDPLVYRYSNIDPKTRQVSPSMDYFTLFDFSAKWDPVPTMLTQNHTRTVKGFMGQTTSFQLNLIKPTVVVMGKNEGLNEARYIHGTFGDGFWSFYGGHDPEDYTHRVGDPEVDLNLHPNSPGYRLILNNILFPAARKKERKT
ncbi:MAG: asparagine synthetase B [Saprospirales bacterium]|nr:MAG: asparagine synthetase B [Saprospirales bacterium]